MNFLSPFPGHTSVPVSSPLVDHTRPFIAEELTHLYHTPGYAKLPDAVRLRYNQLYALYFNEQVAFFEQEMLSPAWQVLLRRVPLPPDLARTLQTFFEEEQRHTAAFRALNLVCEPGFYREQPHYFVRVGPVTQTLLGMLARHRWAAPLLVWLALLQEERSLHYSRRCLERASELEPRFVAMHRAHLADEVGHVGWDERLLDWLWPRMGSLSRTATARLLGWLISEFFYVPKRSALRVLRQLAREFPQIDPRPLARDLRRLADNPDFRQTLYSRRIVPRTFARLDAHPEFASLVRALTPCPTNIFPA